MTSKLLRTIVGVGMALGAVPACLGRTAVGDDRSASDEAGDDTPGERSDARGPDVDASVPIPPDPEEPGRPPDPTEPVDGGSGVPDASPGDASHGDDGGTGVLDASPGDDAGAVDASSDAPIDPYCDVWWPPTKGTPERGRVPCVDPLNECEDAWVPRGCMELLAPNVCSFERSWEGPLYCFDGQWRCPPGFDDGPRCVCFGPLPAGETCATDGGV
jgi:hypothetical protein